jgi:hypothetical protein
MRYSHYDTIVVNRAFSQPEFEGFRPPKSVNSFDWMKDSLIA